MIIAVGDTHGRRVWEEIVCKHYFDRFIFIGDYFDTREGITAEAQVSNFKNILQFKKDNPEKVILLVGNHDHHYFKEVGYQGTSNYQPYAAKEIGELLEEAEPYLQMAHREGDFLFTHAGVSEVFLEYVCVPLNDGVADSLNTLWKENKKAFMFCGPEMYGDNPEESPIWIRPHSLIRSSKTLKKRGIKQVVGHTGMETIALFKDYLFIDTLGTSGEYLIIDGEKVTAGTTK
jgi:hypothetical protein